MALPINESAVMKAHWADWLSESLSLTTMNDKKREKVVHCWKKTGLIAFWDVNERAILTRKAFAATARLFPGHDNVDNSGVVNEEDDKEPEQSVDFSSAVDTQKWIQKLLL